MGDPVEFIALRRGFMGGKLVEPGRKFPYSGPASDFGDKDPWAVPSDSGAQPAKAKPLNGDLKPEEARRAVKRKADGLTGDAGADTLA